MCLEAKEQKVILNFLHKPGFEPKSLGFLPASTISKYLFVRACISFTVPSECKLVQRGLWPAAGFCLNERKSFPWLMA